MIYKRYFFRIPIQESWEVSVIAESMEDAWKAIERKDIEKWHRQLPDSKVCVPEFDHEEELELIED